MSLTVLIRFPSHPLPVRLRNISLEPLCMIIYTWSQQWNVVRALPLLGSRFSLTSSQNYRQEIESRIGARGCVCFVAKGVLWRQQVGLWIPSPARRHEAHAQEASPAKYSHPPPHPTHPLRSTGLHTQRTRSESSLPFAHPANLPSPIYPTAVACNELSVLGFLAPHCFWDDVFLRVNAHDHDLTPLGNHTDTAPVETLWPFVPETL